MKKSLLPFILLSFISFGQDQLTLDAEGALLGVSVAEGMSYFEDERGTMSTQQFLDEKATLNKVQMETRAVDLDFTASTYFIHFTLRNESGKDQSLVLETARPFTNRVSLFCVEDETTVHSGDAIPFETKCLPTNVSALTLFVPSGESREYVLRLNSEGENMGVPMTFFDKETYMGIDLSLIHI